MFASLFGLGIQASLHETEEDGDWPYAEVKEDFSEEGIAIGDSELMQDFGKSFAKAFRPTWVERLTSWWHKH